MAKRKSRVEVVFDLELQGQAQVQTGLSQTGKVASQAAAAMGNKPGGIGDASRQATVAQQQLTYAMSDFAAAGVMGARNNIETLLVSMQGMIKTTGGIKTAMGALLTSFTGVGGILFAVSAALILVEKFSPAIRDAFSSDTAKRIREVSKQIADLKDEIEEAQMAVEEIARMGKVLSPLERAWYAQNEIVEDLRTKLDNLNEGTAEYDYQARQLTEQITEQEEELDRLGQAIENVAAVKSHEAESRRENADATDEETKALIRNWAMRRSISRYDGSGTAKTYLAGEIPEMMELIELFDVLAQYRTADNELMVESSELRQSNVEVTRAADEEELTRGQKIFDFIRARSRQERQQVGYATMRHTMNLKNNLLEVRSGKEAVRALKRSIVQLTIEIALLKVKQKILASMSGGFLGGSSIFRGFLGGVFGGGMASGGIVPSGGGVFDVGEHGRERVILPGGSRVMNAQQTAAMNRPPDIYIDGQLVAAALERSHNRANRSGVGYGG